MAKLIFDDTDEEIKIEDGEGVQEACEEVGVAFACTEGICGTCVIEVLEGHENLSPPTQEEIEFLGEGNTRERLACQCKILEGTVKVRF